MAQQPIHRLFRGYQQRPVMMSPENSRELTQLRIINQQARERAHGDGDRFMEEMGGEKIFKRWYELEMASAPQSFTDDETVARRYAGERGFIISMDVPKDTLTTHYHGEHLVEPNEGEQTITSNYLFSGEEIQHFFESDAASLIDIQQEIREGQLLREGSPSRL